MSANSEVDSLVDQVDEEQPVMLTLGKNKKNSPKKEKSPKNDVKEEKKVDEKEDDGEKEEKKVVEKKEKKEKKKEEKKKEKKEVKKEKKEVKKEKKPSKKVIKKETKKKVVKKYESDDEEEEKPKKKEKKEKKSKKSILEDIKEIVSGLFKSTLTKLGEKEGKSKKDIEKGWKAFEDSGFEEAFSEVWTENLKSIEKNIDSINKSSAKRNSKPKDPNAPKRAKNGYLFFTIEKRTEFKTENPDLKPTEITKKLSEEWNKIKGTSKAKKWMDMAQEDKERYEEDKKNFTPTEGFEKEEKKKKSKSAYMLWCADNRERVKEENNELLESMTKKEAFGQMSKLMGAEWKEAKQDKDVFKEYSERAKEANSDDDEEKSPKKKKKSNKKKVVKKEEKKSEKKAVVKKDKKKEVQKEESDDEVDEE